NAMTSDRPYRDAMPSRVARLRLAQGVESQFDTTVIAAFEAILAGASEDYRLAREEDFTLEEQDHYPLEEDGPEHAPARDDAHPSSSSSSADTTASVRERTPSLL